MKSYFTKWIEEYLFFPTPLQQLISILFLPLTLLYCVISTYKRISAKPFNFGIPIISIGNLLVGGTGKTPVTIALAKDKKDTAIILRGYGRESKGLFVVSNKGKILEDVTISGDEAFVLAHSLPNSIVIVSENRIQGILKAKELGAKIIFLDDGYSKHNILKLDILLRPKKEPTNIFCLPSGGYRDTKMMYSFSDIVLKEDKDFKRVVTIKKENKIIDNLPRETILLTAISKPERLLEFLPKNIKMISFSDHHNYTQEDIENIKAKYPNYAIVTTQKDFVKLEKYNLENLYLMDLEITILDEKSKMKIEEYIKAF
jgi:tetraacyldisaccharide 4'-kinase